MTPADSARFELAKRAFKATQPSVTEVQAGVRRARLSLPRPKARRSWISKGLIFVVLAVGSLAYAKPHALTDLVGDMLPRNRGAGKGEHKLGTGVVAPPPIVANTPSTIAPVTAEPIHRAAEPTQPLAAPTQPRSPAVSSIKHPAASVTNVPRSATAATGDQRSSSGPTRAKSAPAGAAETNDAVASNTAAVDAESATLSNWGRVGQALAHGDEASALTVLDQLSQSADVRTRDKADLGRAQLLMAQGNRDAACSLARSLTHRRAGGRIERQALALLKSCEP